MKRRLSLWFMIAIIFCGGCNSTNTDVQMPGDAEEIEWENYYYNEIIQIYAINHNVIDTLECYGEIGPQVGNSR